MERRRLGLTTAALLVVANMVGAGVFTTSGFALADLGHAHWVLLAWFVGGIIALCGALSYGALARHLPESGGEYLFLARHVHPLAGFLAGWVSLLTGFTAPIALSALGLQEYLATTFEIGGDRRWIGTGAILMAGALHGVRLREGVLTQNAAVLVKLVLIAVFVLVGLALSYGDDPVSHELPDVAFGFGAFAESLVWISLAYSGWNAAVYIAGEVREPERNLARALWVSTLVVMGIYLALNAVFLYGAPAEELAGKAEVGAIAAEFLGGMTLRRAISLLVALALFTSVTSMVMAAPRVYARMADDGLFPGFFRIRGEVPRSAIALQVGLAVVVVWIARLRELLGYIGFTLGLSTIATVSCLFLLRRRHGAKDVPVPGYPFVPLAFVLGTLWAVVLMVGRSPAEALVGLGTVALGLPFYALWRRK